MYCVKCKKKVKVDGKYVILKNGRRALSGKCNCGTKVFKMVGNK